MSLRHELEVRYDEEHTERHDVFDTSIFGENELRKRRS